MTRRREFLAAAVALALPRLLPAATDEAVPPSLDHVILGCNDLSAGVAWAESRLGVRAAPGGVHPGRGTRNALLSLGTRRYLEIMAPDPQQPANADTRGLKDLKAPRIIGWASHLSDMQTLADSLTKAGIAFSGPTPGSRRRPDGRLLQWQTLNLNDDAGVLPFFIEWAPGSPHPAEDAPAGAHLLRLTAATPARAAANEVVQALALNFEVGAAARVELHAAFEHAGRRLLV